MLLPDRAEGSVPARSGWLGGGERGHNLPAALTSFVGREEDLAVVVRLLGEARLVTLTGVGGVGKTRLALEVAAGLVDHWVDGAWLVELAPLADPTLVPQTVASVLGVREGPGRPLSEALLAALGPKRLLLLLDNCEHLVQACAELADRLLRACPSLRILATSRETLGITGEATWRVSSLSLPDPLQPPPVERLARYEAVRLFVDRARLAAPMFAVTAGNAAAVAQVCRRLDGIPLAIEMAAARIKALSVEQLAQHLDARFRLLTDGDRAGLPRHRTLRALVDWSYNLLPDREQALFRRLSVFAGGWSLEAVEAVCADPVSDVGSQVPGDAQASPPIPDDVLGLLSRLVDKSLVVVEPGGEGAVRYRLLETLGHYAWEHLAARGDAEVMRSRHAAFFLALAERAEPELYGPRQAAWHDRLRRDHDNLRAALRWYLEGKAPQGLRLARALWWFWHQHQLWTEGRDWLERALTLPEASRTSVARAEALQGAGLMAGFQRDYAAARRRLEESVALARDLGEDRPLSRALGLLGVVTAFEGDHAAASARFEESLAIARAAGDLWGQSRMLHLLGAGALRRGDRAAAGAMLEESLATARASGDLWSAAMTLNTFGDLARAQADYERAGSLYEESATLFRERGVGGIFGGVLHNLGYVALYRGDARRAGALFRDALALFRTMGDPRGTAECLAGLAGVLGARGQPARAAELFGAAEATFEVLGTSISPSNRADYDRNLSAVRAALEEDAFGAAWARGRALSLEEAIAYAPVAAPEAASPRPPAGTSPSRSSVGHEQAALLTAREREVAGLIARGLSNRHIADELVIAERTAANHVRNILAKLEFRGRSQVAVWAVEAGLAGQK